MAQKQVLQSTPYNKTLKQAPRPHTRLYLVRHSNPEKTNYQTAGDANMPLSKQGKLKCQLLSRRLSKLGVDKIYASEFLRAQQTGAPLANNEKIKMIIDPRFNEIDWKDWQRIKYFNLSERARRKSLANFRTFDKQLDKLQTKVRTTLFDIVQSDRGKSVAIFTHGNFIRAAVTGILDADIIGFLSLEIYLTSITEIVADKNNDAKINYVNDIGHLPRHTSEDLFAVK